MNKLSAGFIGLGLAFVVGMFFVGAWLFMLLANVVLHHFGLITLDYTAAMALVLVLSVIGGANYSSGSKN